MAEEALHEAHVAVAAGLPAGMLQHIETGVAQKLGQSNEGKHHA